MAADGPARRRAPLGRLAIAAIGLEVFLGVGAMGGGVGLMMGPHGEVFLLSVSLLAGTPFADDFPPGAILLVVIGMGPRCAGALTWRRHPLAPLFAFGYAGKLAISR